MSKMIQIRNVPDRVHRELKARAAREGMTLSDYLLAELRRNLSHPTVTELRQRLESRAPVRVHEAPAKAVRGERDRR